MYGVLLILVLVITGGAIAFIGDRLGSKVGKKKLSLFGLRPRHTSIIGGSTARCRRRARDSAKRRMIF